MSNLTAIDADGHIIENENDIRKYLQEPWNRRSTALRPGDQPCDNHMFDCFQSERVWSKLSPREQITRWHELMDEHQIETAVCFPTGSGSVVRLQEVPFQIAVARACNDHFAAEYNALSDRVKCVGVLPMRSPTAAAEELERAVKEGGIIGFEILPPGLPVALGDSFYDPVYAAAEKCGAVLGIHGTRSWSREFGAEGLNTFAGSCLRLHRGHLAAVYQHDLPGRAGPLSQTALGIPRDRRDLVALLLGSPRRALGKTRAIRDAPAQRKTQRVGKEIRGLFQHRVGRVAARPYD